MIPEINLDQAILFIDQHGNLQEKARLLYILMEEKPTTSVVRPLLEKQNTDGGFPSRPRGDNPSSVDNTITALWQLNELGLLNLPAAEHALAFLIQSQAKDGSWDENPALPGHDLPPWIVPGELATRLYLTAYAAYWLGRMGHNTHPAFLKAAEHLLGRQDEEGHLPSYLHANWIGDSVFFMAGEHEAAEKGLAWLAARPFAEWEDSQVAWALDCLGTAGLTAGHPFIQSGLNELARRQSAEGTWASEDGEAYAVSATVSTLKVFKLFGLLGLTSLD